MPEQLKKCPFCGGEAVRFDIPCQPGYVLFGCSDDDCCGAETAETLVEWNSRPLEDALAEGLHKILHHHTHGTKQERHGNTTMTCLDALKKAGYPVSAPIRDGELEIKFPDHAPGEH